MKKALITILVLTAALSVALAIRIAELRSAAHGPAGGTGVIEGVDLVVASRLAGSIQAVEVREGDRVRAGQVLVRLDCSVPAADLAEAKARLAAAQAAFEASKARAKVAAETASAAGADTSTARAQLAILDTESKHAARQLVRENALLAQGIATLTAVDDARLRSDTLAHRLAAQRAAIVAARQHAEALEAARVAAEAEASAAEDAIGADTATVAAARTHVGDCTLVAPRDAVVATRDMEPGEAVEPGSVILTLTDLRDARTRFYLPNAELAAAAPGRKVTVLADAYPGKRFHGTIIYVSPRAEFTPRNVQTREDRERLVYAVDVRIPNRGMRLREGMPVEVTIDGSWE